MLNKMAFANSLALTTAVFYVLFYVLNIIAPAVFEYVFNAQFLGADVASFIVGDLSVAGFVGILITVTIMVWVMAYVWGWLYNKFAK